MSMSDVWASSEDGYKAELLEAGVDEAVRRGNYV